MTKRTVFSTGYHIRFLPTCSSPSISDSPIPPSHSLSSLSFSRVPHYFVLRRGQNEDVVARILHPVLGTYEAILRPQQSLSVIFFPDTFAADFSTFSLSFRSEPMSVSVNLSAVLFAFAAAAAAICLRAASALTALRHMRLY